MKNKTTGVGVTLSNDKTDAEGKITIKDLPAGEYAVYQVDGSNESLVGTFVSNIDCEAEVKPTPSCPNFTVTIKDEDGNARPSTVVSVKAKDGTTIVENKTTDENGQIQVPTSELPSGKYDVYEGDLFIGEITVSYKNSPCEAEVAASPKCPTFEVTIKNANGTLASGIELTVKTSTGDTVTVKTNDETKDTFTTDENGKVVFNEPGLFQQGTYTVYKGTQLIGKITIINECKAKLRLMAPPNPGGGGYVPPVTPEEPTDPGTEEPGTEEPTDPGTEEPGTEEPTEPGTEEPGTEEPTEPGTEEPGTEEPTEPGTEDPTPGPTPAPDPTPTPIPSPGPTPSPSPTPTPVPTPVPPTTGTGNTSVTKPVTLPNQVIETVNKHKNLVLGYPKELPTRNELKELLKLYEDYLKMSPAQKREFEKIMDVEKLKALLLAEGMKLPQTNGESNNAMMFFGLLLVVMAATLLVRRRRVS